MNIIEKMQNFVDNYEKCKMEVIKLMGDFLREEETKQILSDFEQCESKKPESIMMVDGSRKKLSPQLKQRFDFCDRLVDITEIMLGIDEIEKYIKSSNFMEWYSVMKSEWYKSAPQIYDKSDISIFSVTSEDDGGYCLLVWKTNKIEPELWHYSGQNEQIFSDLSQYLDWLND